MDELNPDHPVTDIMRGQWHKIVALIMARHGIGRFTVTMEDIELVAGKSVVAHSAKDGLHILLMDETEAVSMAVQHGDIKQ